MDNIKSTTARLRRTFQYPTDDSSSSPELPDADVVLDEEEQENLIASLAEQNSRRNSQFRRVLLALPLLSAVPYLYLIATLRSQTFLLSVLALSSLASTAYLLYRLPPAETGIPLLDNDTSCPMPPGGGSSRAHWWSGGSRSIGGGGGCGDDGSSVGGHPVFGDDNGDYDSARRAGWEDDDDDDDDEEDESSSAGGRASSWQQQWRRHGKRRRASSFSVAALHRSPLETWLPYLNLGLCAVLVVLGLLMGTRGGHSDGLALVGLGNLPAVVYVVVLVAKMVMASVDPKRELGGLRYEYKGA